MALGTCGPRCLLGHGLLCAMRASELHLKGAALLMHHSCLRWVSSDRREYSLSTAWLPCQPGERLFVRLCCDCCCGSCARLERINPLEKEVATLSGTLA